VRLTARGRDEFAAMAREHADWIASLASEMTNQDVMMMLRLLTKMKNSVRTGIARGWGDAA
jgi:DNA-binding MarR family transcriptional regulator